MFSRPWFSLLRRQVLIHRRSLAFCLTVAAVLLGWSALVARPPLVAPAPGAVTSVPSAPAPTPGSVRLPVRFADGEMVSLLHPGQRIDLWATDPRAASSRVIARAAQVVDVPSPASGSLSAGRQSRLVVLDIRASEVELVTRFNANGLLSYAAAQ